ncbi:CPTP protein, partial [Dryoscopus gambensis]|nr:CPTP protein [Dryoscopus gambensis]
AMAAAAAGAFSLREVLEAFKRCVTEQREVLLEPYLSGWRGLIRFLQSLGAVFSFISKDAVAKVSLLERLSGGGQAQQYVSLQAMVQLFLEGLRSGDARTSVVCTDAYNASLAAYHPWVVRKAATVAFCALPSRDAFLEIMNVGPREEAVAMLGEAVPYIDDVYSITQELFAQHKLLDLP